jgi:two-component system chemotaxis response regulator CheB
MSRLIKVLIADDSSAVRGVLSKVIAAEPRLELIGAASNGAIAVDKATRLDPDVIVLDIEMPVMTGLEAVVEIRKVLPTTPIIMFSTLTENGADITLEALSKGASDYATKPTNTGTSLSAVDQIRQDLVTKIVGFGARAARGPKVKAPGSKAPTLRTAAAPRAGRPAAGGRIDALIIGSSTGGPAALERVLTSIPAPLPVPILVVQHMPATFTGVLAQRLSQCCAFPVRESSDGMVIEPGSCYIAAGGTHMTLQRSSPRPVIVNDDGPKVKSCRPSVDVMFDSAAALYAGSVLATVLTGMGDDGLDASRRLVERGVEVIVQDEATSVVWGMPGAIARAGLASACLPIDQIGPAILERIPTRSGAQGPRVNTTPSPPARRSALTTSERGR